MADLILVDTDCQDEQAWISLATEMGVPASAFSAVRRMHRPQDRINALCSRMLIWWYVGETTRRKVHFYKPQCRGRPDVASFNVSHDHTLCVLAVCGAVGVKPPDWAPVARVETRSVGLQGEVGVDCIWGGRDPCLLSMSSRCLSPGEQTLDSIWVDDLALDESVALTSRLHIFLALWTRKEAAVKANGRGLGVEFSRLATVPVVSLDSVPIEAELQTFRWKEHIISVCGLGSSWVEVPSVV